MYTEISYRTRDFVYASIKASFMGPQTLKELVARSLNHSLPWGIIEQLASERYQEVKEREQERKSAASEPLRPLGLPDMSEW